MIEGRSRLKLCVLVLSMVLGFAALPGSALADETFVVETVADGTDDNPGDRLCRTGRVR